jgi:predicted Zn-dependent protease
MLGLPLFAQLEIRYWRGEHAKSDLAVWALRTWANAVEPKVELVEVNTAEAADLRFRWVTPRSRGLYGQSLAHREDGREVYDLVINPAMGDDVVLFLTCVHEAGHALGLEHTANFADIMYSFQYGGDFDEYFNRYRRRLKSREDMATVSPLSPSDVAALGKQLSGRRRTKMRPSALAPIPQR